MPIDQTQTRGSVYGRLGPVQPQAGSKVQAVAKTQQGKKKKTSRGKKVTAPAPAPAPKPNLDADSIVDAVLAKLQEKDVPIIASQPQQVLIGPNPGATYHGYPFAQAPALSLAQYPQQGANHIQLQRAQLQPQPLPQPLPQPQLQHTVTSCQPQEPSLHGNGVSVVAQPMGRLVCPPKGSNAIPGQPQAVGDGRIDSDDVQEDTIALHPSEFDRNI